MQDVIAHHGASLRRYNLTGKVRRGKFLGIGGFGDVYVGSLDPKLVDSPQDSATFSGEVAVKLVKGGWDEAEQEFMKVSVSKKAV